MNTNSAEQPNAERTDGELPMGDGAEDGISGRMRAAVGDLSSRMRTAVGVTKTEVGRSVLPIVLLFLLVVATVGVLVWVRFFGGDSVIGGSIYGIMGGFFLAATALAGLLWRRRG